MTKRGISILRDVEPNFKKWSFLTKKMISVWIEIDDDKKIAKEIIRDVTWFSSADERFLEVF